MTGPVVLVTGTSSGIGRQAVQDLTAAGCMVWATARNVEDIQDLASESVRVAALDVTNEASMQRVVQDITAEGRLDAVVNNAGFGAYLPMEEVPPNVMRQMFDVNIFGLTRMSQLALPHMRSQEPLNGWRGRIVNVGSGAGHVSLPMMGAYCATKHAVRAITMAQHIELRPHGVHACVIEPGRIQTDFGHRAQGESVKARPADTAYGELYDAWSAVPSKPAPHAHIIGRRIVHASTARRPRYAYRAPADARLGNVAKRLLTERALNWSAGRYVKRLAAKKRATS